MTTARAARENATLTTLFLLVASFVIAHALFMVLPGVFESWNAQAFDRLLALRSRLPRYEPAYDDTIVHVDINNSSLQEIGQFYLNRAHFARGVRNLAGMDVFGQLYDFIFAFPQNAPEDQALIEAVSAAHNAYFGVAFGLAEKQDSGGRTMSWAAGEYLERTAWKIAVEGGSNAGSVRYGVKPLTTFPELAANSRGLGSLTIEPDPDGVIRYFPLIVRYGDAFYPSLPLRVICDYLGVTPDRIYLRPGKSLTLQAARRPGGDAADIAIPVDARRFYRVNFIGPWERMRHYKFSAIYGASADRDEMDILRQELRGRIAIISDVSDNSRDVGPVPTDAKFPLSGLAANVMHNILTRSFLRELSPAAYTAIDVLLLAGIFGLAVRLRPVSFLAGSVGLLALYIAAVTSAFLYFQLVLHIVRPLLMMTFAVALTEAYRYIVEEREKTFLRRTFNSYFPPKVVDRVMANPQFIASAGERKELTIMFSDLSGFTRLSARLSPDRIRQLLNDYFEAMIDIAFYYEGTVDKFMGDGLMVFFGDPEPQPDHAVRCVRMAIDMQKRIRDLGEKWKASGETPMQARIGINTGVVVVGNMGSERRLSYTVLGSEVNLAQRFEANAPVGGILISKRTHELLDGMFKTQPTRVQVKGYDDPIEAYVVDIGIE